MTRFKTTIVSPNGSVKASRPCSVIRVKDQKVIASFDSRKACALALGMDSPTISLMINGYFNKKVIDARHGELKIVDGARPIDPRFRRTRSTSTSTPRQASTR